MDGGLAAVLLVFGQLEAWWGVNATHRQGPHSVEAAAFAVTAAAVVLRRWRPLECLTFIVTVSVVEYALVGSPEGFGVMMPTLVASYSVARWETRRPAWWGLVLVFVHGLGWVGFDPVDSTWRLRAEGMLWLSPWVIAWLVGALVRGQAQSREQRRVARQQREARTVAEERNRIARELHDVIGHSVSVMTVQASAVRRRLTVDQAVEREALLTVERVGREALQEMRHMVGVLREEGSDPDREPPPGLAHVDGLCDTVRAAGLPVELTISGRPRPLPGGLDVTAYRVVQEGLTNTLRHATAPGCAQVDITYGDSGLELAVRDNGGPVSQTAAPGHGLLGMRERVTVYGGHLVARPRHGGGFELLATLPWDAR